LTTTADSCASTVTPEGISIGFLPIRDIAFELSAGGRALDVLARQRRTLK